MFQSYGTFPFPPPAPREEAPLSINKRLGRLIKQDLRGPEVKFCLSLLKNISLIAVYSITLNSLDTNFQPLKDGWAFVEALILMIHIDIYLISTLRRLHGYLMPSFGPSKHTFTPFGAEDPIIPCVYLLASHISLALHLTMGIRGWMRFHELTTFQVGVVPVTMFGILGVLSVLNAVFLAGSIISHYFQDRRPNPLSEVPSPFLWQRERERQQRQFWHPQIQVLGRPCRVSKEAVFQTLDPAHYFM